MLLRIAPSLRYHNDVSFTEGMAWPIGSEENNKGLSWLCQGWTLVLLFVASRKPACTMVQGEDSGVRTWFKSCPITVLAG